MGITWAFQPFGDGGWFVDPAGGRPGRGGAAVSVDIADNEATGIRLTDVDFPVGGRLRFQYAVSSEGSFDFFVFRDGGDVLRRSGELGWTVFEHDVAPGLHTFEFLYDKDSSVSRGTDNARIDDLVIEVPCD